MAVVLRRSDVNLSDVSNNEANGGLITVATAARMSEMTTYP